MEIINRIIIRFVQAFVLVFFAFLLSGYYGILLLLPLGIFYHLTSVLTEGLGFNGIFAVLITGPAIGYMLYSAYKIDGFYDRMLGAGIELFNVGKKQLYAYQSMLDGGKSAAADATNQTAQAN